MVAHQSTGCSQAPSLRSLRERQSLPEAVVGIQGSPVPGAVQVLSPFQGGGHEEQEGSVHVMDGAQVTSTFGTDPVDFHMEYIIFAVTRAVSTEAKALYSVCARGKESEVTREALGGGRKLPAPGPPC